MTKTSLRAVAFLAALLTTASLAHAQTFTWDGGGATGAWSDPANWNPDGVPSDGGATPWDTFHFGGSSQLASNNDIGGNAGGWNVNNIEFLAGPPTTGAFTLTDSPDFDGFDMLGAASSGAPDGPATILNSSSEVQTVDVNLIHRGDFNTGLVFDTSGDDLVISGIISSGSASDPVTIQGGNTVTLSGNNSHISVTEVDAGTLLVQHNMALGSTTQGTTVASGARVELASGVTVTGETIAISGNGANFAGALQPSGAVSATWAGEVDLDGSARLGALNGGTLNVTGDVGDGTGTSLTISTFGTGKVVLAGTGSYTGTTSILRGELELGATNALPTTTVLDTDVNAITDNTTVDLAGFDQEIGQLQRSNTGGTSQVTNSAGTLSTLTVTQAGITTYGGDLTGNLAVIKGAGGALTLGGANANTHTGLTTAAGGTLILDKDASGTNAIGGDVSVSGGTLRWDESEQVVDTGALTHSSGTVSFNGQTETLASYTKTGGITSTDSGAAITISGTLDISGGSVFDINSTGGTVSANTVVHSGGALTLGAGGGTLNVGAGGLTLEGASGANFRLNGGTATINLGGDVTTIASATTASINDNGTFSTGGIDLGGVTRTFTVANGSAGTDLDVVVPIINGAVTKEGSGLMDLSGNDANTYTGLTTVNGGTLNLSKSAGTDAVAGDIQVTGGALRWGADNQIADTSSITQTGGTVDFDADDETFTNFTRTSGFTETGGANTITVTGTLEVSGGAQFNINSGSPGTTFDANAVVYTGGAMAIGSGGATLEVGSGGLSMTGSDLSINGGTSRLVLDGDVTTLASGTTAQLRDNGTFSANRGIDLNGADRTFTVADGGAAIDLDVSAPIFNSGATAGIIKEGDGLMRLNNSGTGNELNTYDGSTTVNAGTLELAGTLGNSNILIDGGTLNGSGTLTYNINGATSDLIDLDSGSLDISSMALDLNVASLVSGMYYVVVDYSDGGTLTTSGDPNFFGSIVGSPPGVYLIDNGLQILLVPEPGTLLLLAAGAAFLAGGTRRRRKR